MVSQRVKQRTNSGKKRRFAGNRWTKLNQNATCSNDSLSLTQSSSQTENVGELQTVPANENESVVVMEKETMKKTASASKVIDIPFSPIKMEQPITGNRILDIEILSNVFSTLLCPSCKRGELELSESFKDKTSCIKLKSYLFLWVC